MNLESKTSNTILETPIPISIGDREFHVAPPSFATLMMISGMIPEVPDLQITDSEDEDTILLKVLKGASRGEIICKMVAVLILGAKQIKEHEQSIKKRHDRFFKSSANNNDIVSDLSNHIALEMGTKDIFDVFFSLLKDQDPLFFYQIITFLNGVNLTKKTRH